MISEEGRLWDWAHPVDTNAAAESSDAEFIASLVIPHVDRALALMDRNPSARTHGSMDRAFWYYRTLTNFQSAVWQQPMLAFAILRDYYPGPTEDFDRSVMEQATESALNAWTLCQHRNGAFDEWYLNEYSYCPTAITSAGAALTLTVSRGWLHASPRAKATQALSTSCAWLLKRYNSNVMNQNLAATVALAGLAHVSGQQEWLEGARTKLQRIADDQNKEGWLPEYGGFDFGYSTLTLDFLSIISSLGLAELADAIADRLIRFLNMVLDRGCAIPGRIGSRGTSHAFLAGAISYGRQSSQARALESLLLDLHRKRLAANPGSVDDRYFSYFYFPQFALALKAAADKRADSVSSTRDAATLPESTAHLSSSGIALHRLDRITVVQNRRLGDAFAVLRQNESPLYHLGYTAMV
ncbi:MAG: hypothetical protein ACR2RB_03425, partial [Gammaproteobacteria bacterium]